MVRHGRLDRGTRSIACPPQACWYRYVGLIFAVGCCSIVARADAPREPGEGTSVPHASPATAQNDADRFGGEADSAPPARGRSTLTLNRSPAIFRPGESFSALLQCARIPQAAGRSVVVTLQLNQVGSHDQVDIDVLSAQVDARGDVKPITVESRLPAGHGVYELRCRVELPAEKLWSRLRRQASTLTTIAEPLVVLPTAGSERGDSPSLIPPPPSDPTFRTIIGEILTEPDEQSAGHEPWRVIGTLSASDATMGSLRQWLPITAPNLLPSERSRAFDRLERRRHAGQSVVLIAPEQSLEVKIPRLRSNRPHRVSVSFPSSEPVHLRLDVLDGSSSEPTGQSLIVQERKQLEPDAPFASVTLIVYPSHQGERLRLTSLSRDEPVLIKSVVVEAGPNELTPEQQPRIEAEAPGRLAALNVQDLQWINVLSSDISRDGQLSGFDERTADLYQTVVATGRLIELLNATKINGVVVPISGDQRLWYDSEVAADSTALDQQHQLRLETVLALLDQTHLHVALRVRPSVPLRSVEQAIEREPTAANTMLRKASSTSERLYNPFHPMVREALAQFIREVDQQFSGHPCVRRLILEAASGTHIGLNIDSVNVPSAIVDQFAGQIEGGMPLSQRRGWATDAGRPEFQSWMIDETRALAAAMADAAREQPILLLPGVAPSSKTWEAWSQAADHAGSGSLRVARSTVRPPVSSLSQYMHADRQALTSEEAAPSAARAHVLRLGVTPSRDGVFPTINEPTFSSMAQQIHWADPEVLLLDADMSSGQINESLSLLLEAFGELPLVRGTPVTPADPTDRTAGVRRYSDPKQALWMVSSHAPWPIVLDLEFQSACQLATQGTGLSPLQSSEDSKRHQFLLSAGGLGLISCEDPHVRLQTWSPRPHGKPRALAVIKQKVTWVFERLGTLADFPLYPELSNGDFEQKGTVGISGWLHAQYPPAAVSIDQDQAAEGDRSIRLSNDDRLSNRAWLMSETFPAPESGRLAVSLATRAEPSGSDDAHQLKIVLEGADRDGPFSHAVQWEVPRDGQWQPTRTTLEVDGIDPMHTRDLRLAIDNVSAGTVWIDDVRLHDRFPTESERTHLRNQAFLAVQGLQRANLTPAARLLQNFWARFLLSDMNPVDPTSVKDAVSPARESSAGVTARFRDWLPQSLRF